MGGAKSGGRGAGVVNDLVPHESLCRLVTSALEQYLRSYGIEFCLVLGFCFLSRSRYANH